jgi:flagellar biosynthesis protein FlhG
LANYDQAEGLRRMLEQPKLRVTTFLSSLPDEDKSCMLINLADSLARLGKNTLMVDTKSSPGSIGEWMELKSYQSLLDVVKYQRNIESAIKKISPKLSITQLSGKEKQFRSLLKLGQRELAKVFDNVISRYDFVIVDSELDANDTFIISSLEDSEIIIQVSTDPSTIKNAYSQIKRINEKSGCKKFGVVISGATQKQAQLIYSNLSQTASRYLAVKLDFIGFVPDEGHLRKSIDLGRSVYDVFPLSNAAIAFTQMANQLISSSQADALLNIIPKLGAQIEF